MTGPKGRSAAKPRAGGAVLFRPAVLIPSHNLKARNCRGAPACAPLFGRTHGSAPTRKLSFAGDLVLSPTALDSGASRAFLTPVDLQTGAVEPAWIAQAGEAGGTGVLTCAGGAGSPSYRLLMGSGDKKPWKLPRRLRLGLGPTRKTGKMWPRRLAGGGGGSTKDLLPKCIGASTARASNLPDARPKAGGASLSRYSPWEPEQKNQAVESISPLPAPGLTSLCHFHK